MSVSFLIKGLSMASLVGFFLIVTDHRPSLSRANSNCVCRAMSSPLIRKAPSNATLFRFPSKPAEEHLQPGKERVPDSNIGYARTCAVCAL